jgi:hypothetical protein
MTCSDTRHICRGCNATRELSAVGTDHTYGQCRSRAPGRGQERSLAAMLVAERCAALSGRDDDFVMFTTIAYCGNRWSEAIGLPLECVHRHEIDIDWKLYELNGRFYRGAPKDGSMPPADLPPFLGQLLMSHVASLGRFVCNCHNDKDPGVRVVGTYFLGRGTVIFADPTTVSDSSGRNTRGAEDRAVGPRDAGYARRLRPREPRHASRAVRGPPRALGGSATRPRPAQPTVYRSRAGQASSCSADGKNEDRLPPRSQIGPGRRGSRR